MIGSQAIFLKDTNLTNVMMTMCFSFLKDQQPSLISRRNGRKGNQILLSDASFTVLTFVLDQSNEISPVKSVCNQIKAKDFYNLNILCCLNILFWSSTDWTFTNPFNEWIWYCVALCNVCHLFYSLFKIWPTLLYLMNSDQHNTHHVMIMLLCSLVNRGPLKVPFNS